MANDLTIDQVKQLPVVHAAWSKVLANPDEPPERKVEAEQRLKLLDAAMDSHIGGRMTMGPEGGEVTTGLRPNEGSNPEFHVLRKATSQGLTDRATEAPTTQVEDLSRPQVLPSQALNSAIDKGLWGIPGGVQLQLSKRFPNQFESPDESYRNVVARNPLVNAGTTAASVLGSLPLAAAAGLPRTIPTGLRSMSGRVAGAAAKGAGVSTVAQGTSNVLNDRPLGEGVGMAALVGGAVPLGAEAIGSYASISRNPHSRIGGVRQQLEQAKLHANELDRFPEDMNRSMLPGIKQEEQRIADEISALGDASKAEVKGEAATAQEILDRTAESTKAGVKQQQGEAADEIARQADVSSRRLAAEKLRQQDAGRTKLDTLQNSADEQAMQLEEAGRAATYAARKQKQSMVDESELAGSQEVSNAAAREATRLHDELNAETQRIHGDYTARMSEMNRRLPAFNAVGLPERIKSNLSVGENTLGKEYLDNYRRMLAIAKEGVAANGGSVIDADRGKQILDLVKVMARDANGNIKAPAVNLYNHLTASGAGAELHAMGEDMAKRLGGVEARRAALGEGGSGAPLDPYAPSITKRTAAANTLARIAEPKGRSGMLATQAAEIGDPAAIEAMSMAGAKARDLSQFAHGEGDTALESALQSNAQQRLASNRSISEQRADLLASQRDEARALEQVEHGTRGSYKDQAAKLADQATARGEELASSVRGGQKELNAITQGQLDEIARATNLPLERVKQHYEQLAGMAKAKEATSLRPINLLRSLAPISVAGEVASGARQFGLPLEARILAPAFEWMAASKAGKLPRELYTYLAQRAVGSGLQTPDENFTPAGVPSPIPGGR